jgi:hypothetical protein
MEIIESAEPTFRYRWRWGPNEPTYLAGTRVAVVHLPPEDFAGRCTTFVQDFLQDSPRLQGRAGGMEARGMGRRWTEYVNTKLGAALRAEGVPDFPFADDLDPMLVAVRDATAFHHAMPMWTSVLGAWCIAGPERVMRFPLMGLEVPFRPGTVVLFDTAQPQALLRPGQTRFDAQDCPDPENVVFVSFSAAKEGALGEMLNAQAYDPAVHAGVRTTVEHYQPCRTTGTVAFQS